MGRPALTLAGLRRERGLSLRALAKRLDVSHVFVGEVERGKRPIPIARLDDWSAALEFPANGILALLGVCLHCRGTGRADRAEADRDVSEWVRRGGA